MKRIYFETEETKITKTKGWIEYDTDFTQFYHSFQKLIVKFKSISEVALLFYYCTECNKNGLITTNNSDYEKFIDNQKRLGGNIINRASFTKCIKNLADNKVIIKSSRGVYYLNPLVIWNDTIDKRKEVIESISYCTLPDRNKYLID